MKTVNAQITVKERDYFANHVEYLRFTRLKNYASLSKEVNKTLWVVIPSTVNAFYLESQNKIIFPAGVLQSPIYDKNAPRAVSYGAIGMVVGHEITHGFDSRGKDFTFDGNIENWWTNKSSTEFVRRSQCFIKQYSKFSANGKNSNGELTLAENLSDNGGLRLSYQAYRNWVSKHGEEKTLPGLNLTPDQLFFLSFGQILCGGYRQNAVIRLIDGSVHSLFMFRVAGTLQNNKEFSKAYKCPVGSRMNPTDKCRLW